MGKDKTQRKHLLRHQPLYDDIRAEQIVTTKGVRHKKESRQEAQDKQGKKKFLPKQLSERILKQVQKQLEEEKESSPTDTQEDINSVNNNNASGCDANEKFLPESADRSRLLGSGSDEDDEDDDTDNDTVEDSDRFSEDLGALEANLEIDPRDERLIEMFMPKERQQKQTLYDFIAEKIAQKEERLQRGECLSSAPSINPKVYRVYTKVGKIMEKYTSGKVPKAFKIIPALTNWEEILFLTHPEKWSPSAVRVATRMFASAGSESMAQKFYNMILLPRVREDIHTHKKLNWHFYQALKKALFKPAAFYKGLLFPLCESGDCTLKEATIIGSVLKKVSIPAVHSAVALLKIAQMDYSGPNSLFIRILLDKKYALPYTVIDALVEHFLKFKNDPREMPVLWHQSLLSLAQRYKTDLTLEQKEQLKLLLREKNHSKITPEIRKELFSSRSRHESDSAIDTIDFASVCNNNNNKNNKNNNAKQDADFSSMSRNVNSDITDDNNLMSVE
jgi:essential nuclear protein 1